MKVKLIAIDPGSNKCGLAFFEAGRLMNTFTLISDQPTPLLRRLSIAGQLKKYLKEETSIASEEPILLGRNNNGMQKLLGMIELLSEGNVSFFHPMTVKKQIGGSGKAEKLELAIAAGEKLVTEEEKEILADAISREAFDETDAVAIGLTYLEKLI